MAKVARKCENTKTNNLLRGLTRGNMVIFRISLQKQLDTYFSMNTIELQNQ